MKETYHGEFYTPELRLDMGTGVDKYAKEEDEWKRAACSYLKSHSDDG